MAGQLVARIDASGGAGTLQIWYDPDNRWWNLHVVAGPIEARVTGTTLSEVLTYANDIGP